MTSLCSKVHPQSTEYTGTGAIITGCSSAQTACFQDTRYTCNTVSMIWASKRFPLPFLLLAAQLYQNAKSSKKLDTQIPTWRHLWYSFSAAEPANHRMCGCSLKTDKSKLHLKMESRKKAHQRNIIIIIEQNIPKDQLWRTDKKSQSIHDNPGFSTRNPNNPKKAN